MTARNPLKEYNITERRVANYVDPEVVAGMGTRVVYKIAEKCTDTTDTFQSTVSSIRKLEYRIGMITHALNDNNLIDCFDYFDGAKKLIHSFKKKTDRLVVLACIGYTDGSWDVPPENKTRGWLSIKVKAVKPVCVWATYDECMRDGKEVKYGVQI